MGPFGSSPGSRVYELRSPDPADRRRYVGYGSGREPWTKLKARGDLATWLDEVRPVLDWTWLPSCMLKKHEARRLAVHRRKQLKADGYEVLDYCRRVPVLRIAADGSTTRYSSIMAAARAAGRAFTGIRWWMQNGRADHDGYRWRADT